MKKRIFVLLMALLCLVCALVLISCDDDDVSNGGDTPQGGNQPGDETSHIHIWSEWNITTPATCSAAGVETRTCACGERETQAIAMKGAHFWNTNNVCAHCGTVLNYTTSLLYELNVDGVSYKVIGKSDEVLEDIVIPPYYDSLPVTAIGEQAFGELGNEIAFTDGWNFVSVTIPHTVISIEFGAFSEFWGLGTVHFADGSQLKSIGSAAFEATGLSSLDLPNSLITIERDAFSGCNILTNITIPKNVVSIGENAFSSCWKLIEIKNLSSLEITVGSAEYGGIGYYAKNVYTADSGESKLFSTADDFVFYDDGNNCYLMSYKGNQADLVLPDLYNGSFYGIYSGAFFGKFGLNSVVVARHVTSIDNSSFLFCDGLDAIFYEGQKADLEITYAAGDDPDYRGPVISYYSEAQPTESGNYWYYVEGAPTAWPAVTA